MRKLIVLRRTSQAFFLGLFIYILWSTTYPLKGMLPPGTFFKFDPLMSIFISISERIIIAGSGFAAAMLLSTLVLGRYFCGWICPLGTAMDLCAALNKKKLMLSWKANIRIKNIKFVLLSVFLIFALAGSQVVWVLDPLVIMARFVSLNLIPAVTGTINTFFIFIIQKFQLYNGGLYDLYSGLRTSFLGVNIYYFDHSLLIFLFFTAICTSAVFVSRLWCRAVCPLGAVYAFISRYSFLTRSVEDCSDCAVCTERCRMSAIKDSTGYIKSECILCMDCIYDCPRKTTSFRFFNRPPGSWPANREIAETHGISRKEFIIFLISSFFLTGYRKSPRGASARGVSGKKIIRPPASSPEKEFLNLCIRCGNCMKVCITNGLQPVLLQSGLEGIWTPALVPEIGYCEYNCTLCGNACPTGAIKSLPLREKQKIKLGIAKVDKDICLAWKYGLECLVCEEHCPVHDKAIKMVRGEVDGKVVGRPVVDRDLCVGCGICQNKCPVRPVRAIKVDPEFADRG